MSVPYYRPARPDMVALKRMCEEAAKSGTVSNGPMCRSFEQDVRDYHNVRYALSCSNATNGLILALRALKMLTDAKECVIPAFTWWSDQFAVESAGLSLLYADVEMEGWMMEPVTRKNAIIMPTCVFGGAVRDSAYEGHVLLDAAHALATPMDLSEVEGAVISFAPSKLMTCGEGGMLLTDNSKFATAFALLRDRFARMSELNAIMGLTSWGGLEAQLRDRRNRFQRYDAMGFGTPQKVRHTNYSTAAFRCGESRDAVVKGLKERGVETRVYYEPLWKGLPHTDQLFKEMICLPNWYGCPTDEVLKALSETIHTP
jgi:dTDP-4-amino-4,6-dideoxygalactose transaminase